MLNDIDMKDFEKTAREKYPEYPAEEVAPMLLLYECAYYRGFKAGMKAARGEVGNNGTGKNYTRKG